MVEEIAYVERQADGRIRNAFSFAYINVKIHKMFSKESKRKRTNQHQLCTVWSNK